MKAQRGSRGIAVLFFNLGAGWGWVVNPCPDRLTLGNDPAFIVKVSGWDPGPV
jgi:hypothetical protein